MHRQIRHSAPNADEIVPGIIQHGTAGHVQRHHADIRRAVRQIPARGDGNTSVIRLQAGEVQIVHVNHRQIRRYARDAVEVVRIVQRGTDAHHQRHRAGRVIRAVRQRPARGDVELTRPDIHAREVEAVCIVHRQIRRRAFDAVEVVCIVIQRDVSVHVQRQVIQMDGISGGRLLGHIAAGGERDAGLAGLQAIQHDVLRGLKRDVARRTGGPSAGLGDVAGGGQKDIGVADQNGSIGIHRIAG